MNPTPLPSLQKNQFYPKKKNFDNNRRSDHHHQQHQQQHQQQQQQQDRFADAEIGDFVGKLYELCKDQNGCRFLQKKIEEKENGEKNLEIVFDEIHPHFTELMTGKVKRKTALRHCRANWSVCVCVCVHRSFW